MAHLQAADEFVREYLIYRGLTATAKAFESEVKGDKEKCSRADRIAEAMMSNAAAGEAVALRDRWVQLESGPLARLEAPGLTAARRLEAGTWRLCCAASARVGPDKLRDCLTKVPPDLLMQSDWREILAAAYSGQGCDTLWSTCTKSWQDQLALSLHNLLAVVLQSGGGAALAGHPAPQNKHTPSLLLDDYEAIGGAETDGSGDKEARGLRSLLRQMTQSSPHN